MSLLFCPLAQRIKPTTHSTNSLSVCFRWKPALSLAPQSVRTIISTSASLLVSAPRDVYSAAAEEAGYLANRSISLFASECSRAAGHLCREPALSVTLSSPLDGTVDGTTRDARTTHDATWLSLGGEARTVGESAAETQAGPRAGLLQTIPHRRHCCLSARGHNAQPKPPSRALNEGSTAKIYRRGTIYRQPTRPGDVAFALSRPTGGVHSPPRKHTTADVTQAWTSERSTQIQSLEVIA